MKTNKYTNNIYNAIVETFNYIHIVWNKMNEDDNINDHSIEWFFLFEYILHGSK